MSVTFGKTAVENTVKTTVECYRNLNLLAHAQIEELDIGSQCGGHGVCGGDRVQVSSNEPLSPLSEAERKHLSAEEISAGWRLACQCYPSRDGQVIRCETV